MTETYTTSPLVVRDLFTPDIYQEILRFMDVFLPLHPLSSDRAEVDSPHKFNRRSAHNTPFFVNIHQQLTDYASEIFGEKVKPSYVFLSLYENGGQCPLHLDRPQCRYTIDYLIRQQADNPWPINIGCQMDDDELSTIEMKHPSSPDEIKAVLDSNKWTEVLLNPNDAVCYSGTNAWHYRPVRSNGTADLVFWHFVPEEFSGPLN